MAVRIWTIAASAFLCPATAQAHAFAERYDLPLPLGFYLAGAGLAVALSFLGSLLLMRRRGLKSPALDISVPSGLARIATLVVRASGVVLLFAVLAIGIGGPQSPTQNFATVFVWVVWWVGFVLFTALVTDPWSAGNPFRTVVGWVLRITGLGRRERVLPAAADWLAVAGLLSIAWLELGSDWSEEPRALVVIIFIYAGVLLAGSCYVGVQSWFAHADPLSRLLGLLGHAAPLATGAGRERLRLPAAGLVGIEVGVAGAVFIVCMIAIVLFDGLAETPFWAAILDWITRSQTLRPWLLEIRAGGIDILKLIRGLGLLTMVAAAVLLYFALALVMCRFARGGQRLRTVFTGFAASLLPIVVAYHLAHYFSYLALAGQLVAPIASDPLGLGWDLFGTANNRIDLGVVNAESVWWLAAIALVTGHALSVLVAHAESLRLYPDQRLAVRSQIPMMVFMVGLTSLSLWILAQPIVA